MNFSWPFLIDMGILGAALMAATWIRSRVRFFQRFLIPNALTAGFMLFPPLQLGSAAFGNHHRKPGEHRLSLHEHFLYFNDPPRNRRAAPLQPRCIRHQHHGPQSVRHSMFSGNRPYPYYD